MVEQQKRRLEQEMTNLVDEIDKHHLRKMQAAMHRCAANCCDNANISLSNVQSCVERCSGPLNSAQGYVQKELEHLQNRIQRCVMDCNDLIKDKMGPNPTNTDIDKYTAMFDSCAVTCVDTHLKLIPNLMKTMNVVLSKKQYPQSEERIHADEV